MINSILTIVNNITTYVTNNSDVFKVAFILAIVTTIASGIPFDIIWGDIPNILIVFISLTGEDNQTKHEMNRLSKELYEQAEEILKEHIEELKELSRFLMRNGYADGHDIKKIFDAKRKRENGL